MPAARELQFAVTAGFNSILTKDTLLEKNQGAEIGIMSTLPVTLWKEHRNLVTLRGQFTSFQNGIDSTGANGDPVKLSNASHSQLRADFRQVFTYAGIDWSAGIGMQVPLTTNILTPRGEFSFADTKAYYPDSEGHLARIDRSYAFYLRLGIDQKLLSDALVLGVAFEISALEFPKTGQRFVLNFYAGARVW